MRSGIVTGKSVKSSSWNVTESVQQKIVRTRAVIMIQLFMPVM